ncbi:MAG: hypothetical protein FJX34_05635, partial [Alphaproteobacteria bacterium]|nr:hypothetical protein [Alphaproteobacteria bacterium]
MTKLSSLSSSSASADPYGLSAKLNKITDLQIRILLSEIFAAQGNSDAAEIPDDDLIRQRQYWASQLGANTSTQDLTGAVESAMQVAYDYFKNHSGIEKSSLLPTGQFAAYVTSFLERNKGECCEIMRKFCDYLYQVGLRPQERQAALLQSFPPEAQYLNCLGGTSERIDDLYAELTSQEKHRPFLRAHDVVMRQVVDALKKNVLSGNEVHIPRYLEYSLGLRAGMVIYPQSQIPLTASFAIHLNYPSILKKFLLKNLSEELAERQKDIRAIYQEIGEKFPGRDLQKMDVINDAELVKFLNNRLKRYEVDGGSFVEFADDECTTCRLDLSRFEKVAAIPPSIKLLNDFLAREEIQNLTNEDALSFKGKEFTELASDPKIFFSERGWNCVVLLLTEEVGKPTIYRDSVVGFEALWMMGEHFAGNAPTVFVAAVNELGGLQKIRNKILPNIAKLLPHQAGKMARIESLHGHYMA